MVLSVRPMVLILNAALCSFEAELLLEQHSLHKTMSSGFYFLCCTSHDTWCKSLHSSFYLHCCTGLREPVAAKMPLREALYEQGTTTTTKWPLPQYVPLNLSFSTYKALPSIAWGQQSIALFIHIKRTTGSALEMKYYQSTILLLC